MFKFSYSDHAQKLAAKLEPKLDPPAKPKEPYALNTETTGRAQTSVTAHLQTAQTYLDDFDTRYSKIKTLTDDELTELQNTMEDAADHLAKARKLDPDAF